MAVPPEAFWVLWPLAVYGALALAGAALSALDRRWRGCGRQRPFVSIVLIARNKERLIEGTVRSLCALAAYANPAGHEIVAVNDRSDDQTGAILERLSRRCAALRVVHMADLGANPGSPADVGLFVCRSPVALVLSLQGSLPPRTLLQRAAFFLAPAVGEAADSAEHAQAGHLTGQPHGSGFQGKERADQTSN